MRVTIYVKIANLSLVRNITYEIFDDFRLMQYVLNTDIIIVQP